MPENYLFVSMKRKIFAVIAAYNEEKHIGGCLESLLQNDYPINSKSAQGLAWAHPRLSEVSH